MTEHTHPTDTTDDPGPERASGEVRSDAAGSKTDPPGGGPVDDQAVERAREELERAGGGH